MAIADNGAWLNRFQSALAHPEAADWRALFADECYWRDLVALSWNIVTLEGPDAIAAMASGPSRVTMFQERATRSRQ